jgi:hypothetical protein
MPSGPASRPHDAHVRAYHDRHGLCRACGGARHGDTYGSFCEDCTALNYHRMVGSFFNEPDGTGQECRTRTRRMILPQAAWKLSRDE